MRALINYVLNICSTKPLMIPYVCCAVANARNHFQYIWSINMCDKHLLITEHFSHIAIGSFCSFLPMKYFKQNNHYSNSSKSQLKCSCCRPHETAQIYRLFFMINLLNLHNIAKLLAKTNSSDKMNLFTPTHNLTADFVVPLQLWITSNCSLVCLFARKKGQMKWKYNQKYSILKLKSQKITLNRRWNELNEYEF